MVIDFNYFSLYLKIYDIWAENGLKLGLIILFAKRKESSFLEIHEDGVGNRFGVEANLRFLFYGIQFLCVYHQTHCTLETVGSKCDFY